MQAGPLFQALGLDGRNRLAVRDKEHLGFYGEDHAGVSARVLLRYEGQGLTDTARPDQYLQELRAVDDLDRDLDHI
jgi:hypothetical protein